MMPKEGSRYQPTASAGKPKLSIRIIGRFSMRVGERELGSLSRKSRALLGYLALAEAGQETRERLVGLLWSESAEEKARASLRQALHEIRDVLEQAGFDGLTADKQALRLDRTRVEVDIWELLEEAAVARPNAILAQSEWPMERLLVELDTVDPAFRVWLMAKRQSLGDRLIRLIETAMRDTTKPAADREALARALRNLDATHEEAARVLIRARAEAGDTGGALGIYKALWDLLEQEYDVEPSKQTQELIAAIKLGRPVAEPVSRPDPPPAALAKRAARTIVLPDAPPPGMAAAKGWPKLMLSIAGFDGSATKPEHRYLVEGFRRELIACLVRFREWVVRDATLSAPAPASAANSAEYIIEASAFETGSDALRVVITLRDLATGTFLWSERLNVSIGNWFEAQQLVVRRITTALNVHLSAERLVSVAHRPSGDLKAYDAWLLGQATFLSFDAKNWERARDLFRRVIAQMPDFAPAYSSLAQLDNTRHLVMPGILRDPRRTREALACAREASRLDPIDSRSQLCLGWSHAMAGQYEQAIVFTSLAYDLNENDPWAIVSSAGCLAVCGEHDQAAKMAEHALQLPLTPSPLQWAYHVAIRFLAGDFRGAIRAADAAGDFSYLAVYKVAALFHLGEHTAAADELQRYVKLIRARWSGTEPASDTNIARWLLTMIPIRRRGDWQLIRDGLAGAGAVVQGITHEQ